MKKVKCVNGHFYDADRFSACPFCGDCSGTIVETFVPHRTGFGTLLPKTEPLFLGIETSPTLEKTSRKCRIDELAPTERLMPEDEVRLQEMAAQYGSIPETVQENDIHIAEAVIGTAEEPVEEPTAEPTKEPTKESAAEPTAEPAEESVEEPTAEPAEEPVEEPTAEPAEEPVEEPPAEPAEEPVEEPPAEPAEEPVEEPAPSPLVKAVEATASKNISALPKTVAYYNFDRVVPPVGWLVCTKGACQGQAFECRTGRNRIGRGADMDINLAEEHTVSRETHAILIYEPRQRKFYIQAGSGEGLTYLNDSLVFSHDELRAYDKLALGKAEFVFLPLCGDRFTWDDYITEA